jgi:ubiquinol-cytochrome c reductase cytochrome c subunit
MAVLVKYLRLSALCGGIASVVVGVALLTTAALGSAAPSSGPANEPGTASSASVASLPRLFAGSSTRATPAQVAEGKALYIENCSSCHGLGATGSERAPSLLGLGPATIDFWVSTGRMPLADPVVQPMRKPVKFTRDQVLAIVAYVTSLAPGGPLIPDISGYKKASLSEGMQLFALNCAGCHTITGAGDALANGAVAPSLHYATPEQIAEAIRTGPSNMPIFGPGNLSDQQVDSIVRYVTEDIQHPVNIGGAGLGGVGPVAEGFVGLLIGVGLLMLVAYWVGDRA